eukprot:10334780-Lingulodinium_polyedra.AAC.1
MELAGTVGRAGGLGTATIAHRRPWLRQGQNRGIPSQAQGLVPGPAGRTKQTASGPRWHLAGS